MQRAVLSYSTLICNLSGKGVRNMQAKAWLIVTASNCCKSQLRRCWRKKQVAFNAVVHDKGTEQTDNLLLRMVEEFGDRKEHAQTNIRKAW